MYIPFFLSNTISTVLPLLFFWLNRNDYYETKVSSPNIRPIGRLNSGTSWFEGPLKKIERDFAGSTRIGLNLMRMNFEKCVSKWPLKCICQPRSESCSGEEVSKSVSNLSSPRQPGGLWICIESKCRRDVPVTRTGSEP